MPYSSHMWRSTFVLLILSVLSHIIKCQNVLEIQKYPWNTLWCTVHLLCSQKRAPPTYLNHFLLDTVVSGFSFWLYISLDSRTKRLLINQPKRNLLQGHFKNYQLQSPLAKYARVNIICPLNTDPPTPPISSKVWKCMRQWGRKRCKQGEEVTGQLYFTCHDRAVVVEREIFNSHELLWDFNHIAFSR